MFYFYLYMYRLIFCDQLLINFIFIEIQNQTNNNISHYSILFTSNRISAELYRILYCFICYQYYHILSSNFARMNEIYGIDDSVPICTIGNIYYSWFCYSKPSN